MPSYEAEPYFEIRRSRIQGRGAFAIRAIPKGARIAEYAGQRISNQEADARSDDARQRRHHTFLFAIDENITIDGARKGNDARFINHSCAPNCEAIEERGRIFIHARRNISAGAELSYDYAYVVDDEYDDDELRRIYACRCGTTKCRGTLAAPRKRVAAKRIAVERSTPTGSAAKARRARRPTRARSAR